MNQIIRMINMNTSVLLLLLTMAGWLTACTKNTAPKSTETTQQDYGRLPYVVEDNYTYSLYYQGLAASGYADTLADEAGPFTILVPNNDAMRTSSFTYSNNSINYFLQAFDPTLAQYIRYMIIPQKVSFSTLPLGQNETFPTLQGAPVYVSRYLSGGDTVTTVNGITVIATDIPASNGLIEVLSAVPEPVVYPNLWQKMLADGSLTFFTAAIERAGLQSLFEDPTQSLTVLAPSNYAFTQSYAGGEYPDLTSLDSIRLADPVQLKNILLYHVLKGIWFTNDFAKADTLGYGDSVQLIMYNGETMTYTGGQFFSTGLVPSFESVIVDGHYVQEHIGPLAPVSAYYYSEFVYDVPNIAFINRPTGNGVLQEITSVMAP